MTNLIKNRSGSKKRYHGEIQEISVNRQAHVVVDLSAEKKLVGVYLSAGFLNDSTVFAVNDDVFDYQKLLFYPSNFYVKENEPVFFECVDKPITFRAAFAANDNYQTVYILPVYEA